MTEHIDCEGVEIGSGMDKETIEKYKELLDTLHEAFIRAAHGKGKERHAENKPFVEQLLFKLRKEEGRGFIFGQVRKKLQEVKTMKDNQAIINELLDCIVYISGEIITLKMEESAKTEMWKSEEV